MCHEPLGNARVHNQFDELRDVNLLGADPSLAGGIGPRGAQAWVPQLHRYAHDLGSSDRVGAGALGQYRVPADCSALMHAGACAKRWSFIPAWHALLGMYRAQGLVSLPFDNAQPGRFSAWAAGFYLHGQVEQGTLCPATMTTAAIGLLRQEPALWAQLQAGLVQPQL